jgi:predicted alpha/beta hydrolase family esterase
MRSGKVPSMSHPKLFTMKDKSFLPDLCEMDWDVAEFAPPEDFAASLPPIRLIILSHSRNDQIVPSVHLEFWKEKLPQATVRLLIGSEHSFIAGLPELVRDLKNL